MKIVALKLHKMTAAQWKNLLLPVLYACLICCLLSLLPLLIQYLSCSCTVMFMQRRKEAICQLRVMVLKLPAPCRCEWRGRSNVSLSPWTTVHKTLPFLSCTLSSGRGTSCFCLCLPSFQFRLWEALPCKKALSCPHVNVPNPLHTCLRCQSV